MKYSGAKWVPGPSGKQGYSSYPYGTAKLGVVNHSAEGWRGGLVAQLANPNAGSWHFTVYQDGSIEQHYDSDAVAWHCGVRPEWRRESNATLIGIEHEGVAGQPLTEAQYQASLKVNRRLFETYKWGEPKRVEPGKNLWEHRELSSTACPSGRIPWDRLIADMKAKEDVVLILPNGWKIVSAEPKLGAKRLGEPYNQSRPDGQLEYVEHWKNPDGSEFWLVSPPLETSSQIIKDKDLAISYLEVGAQQLKAEIARMGVARQDIEKGVAQIQLGLAKLYNP